MEEKHKGRKTKALVYAGDMQTKYSLGKNPALNMYLVTSHDSVQKKISEDPLIKTIFRLNERQKEALLAFLNTLK